MGQRETLEKREGPKTMILTFNGTLADFQVLIAILRNEDPDQIAALIAQLATARATLEAAEAADVVPLHPTA